VLVTHDQSEVARVAVLRDGRIVQDGPPRVTVVDREVAAFFGSLVTMPADIPTALPLRLGKLPVGGTNGRSTLLLRPE
jgi:ABC-type sulfate/molybdate transport systems ATPase subunit